MVPKDHTTPPLDTPKLALQLHKENFTETLGKTILYGCEVNRTLIVALWKYIIEIKFSNEHN